MNGLEKQMLAALGTLRNDFGAVAVRAEFESEGLKLEELLRLKELSMRSGLGLTLKIGGCESVRDLLESRLVGATEVVAPIIESPFALRKYVQAAKKVFPEDELGQIRLSCNIETDTAVSVFPSIVASPDFKSLTGVIIERVDLCFSRGLSDDQINSEEIFALVRQTAALTASAGLDVTIGGGVSAASLPQLRALHRDGHCQRYETRKVTFDAALALPNRPEKGLLAALGFEVLFLRNKQDFYGHIDSADQLRLRHLESRYWAAITEVLP